MEQNKRRASPETGISPFADSTVSKAVASTNKKAQTGSLVITGVGASDPWTAGIRPLANHPSK